MFGNKNMSQKKPKTCIHGHDLTKDNVYSYKITENKTSYQCKTCLIERSYDKYWNDEEYREKIKARSRQRHLKIRK